jgi:hypothetical protein
MAMMGIRLYFVPMAATSGRGMIAVTVCSRVQYGLNVVMHVPTHCENGIPRRFRYHIILSCLLELSECFANGEIDAPSCIWGGAVAVENYLLTLRHD